MTPLMNALREDHQHMRSLLTLLRNKLATKNRADNYTLMGQAIDYLDEYAEQCHHRKENSIFAFLLVEYPQAREQVEMQLEEHRELETLIQGLKGCLEEAKDGDAARGRLFNEQLDHFIGKQLSHLNREETLLFPLIERTLTPDNWLQFHSRVPDLGNRANEQRLDQRYLELREALIEDLA